MARTSKAYDAAKKRIKKLPWLINLIVKARTKATALSFIKMFHDGIKSNAFGLKKLKDGTIKRKRSMHLMYPTVPLYGFGDAKKKNSYVNMLRIRELSNGYRVAPSIGMHYSGAIKLKKLLMVHEFGATLVRKSDKAVIRIPARPALYRAYRAALANARKEYRLNTKKLKRAAARYLKIGASPYFDNEPINMLKPYKETEKRATGN